MDIGLIILILVAVGVAVKLYQVLGVRTGHERPPQDLDLSPARARRPTPDIPAEPAPVDAEKPPAPVSPAAAPLREADPRFDEARFLAGAKDAYELIIGAFASGDVKPVSRYLSPSVYDGFRAAVDERQTRKLAMEVKFVGVDSAKIVRSEAAGGAMSAVVEFASDQVRVTRDETGAEIEGDASQVARVVDRWTFSRKIGSDDPNWLLIATGGVN